MHAQFVGEGREACIHELVLCLLGWHLLAFTVAAAAVWHEGSSAAAAAVHTRQTLFGNRGDRIDEL